MIYKCFVNAAFFSLLVLTVSGCQNQTDSNPANAVDSNASASKSADESTDNNGTLKTIKFESADKAEIIGTFYESSKADSPAILMLHQWQSNRKSYDDFAKRLQAKGFGVLAIDGRGFGESVKTTDGKMLSPDNSDYNVGLMKEDVKNAFDFLAKQKNVNAEKIAVVGASYGSSLTIIFGAESKSVKAAVLLSPGLNYFGNMPTEPAIKRYGNRPLLLVAAEDDKASADSVRKLKTAGANDKHEVKIYPKGGHGTGIFKAKVGLEGLLEEFLTKSLQ